MENTNENIDDYYHVEESQIHAYYQVPKILLSKKYSRMDGNSKILYGLLLDRNQLSIKNNWFDKLGRIYIVFSRKDAMELLNVSNKTITKYFNELLNYNLIDEKRLGVNKPNIIYVKKIKIKLETVANTSSDLKCKNYTSSINTGSVESTLLEVYKVHSNKSNIITLEEEEEKTHPTLEFLKSLAADFEDKDFMCEAFKEMLQYPENEPELEKVTFVILAAALKDYKKSTSKINKPIPYFSKCLLRAIKKAEAPKQDPKTKKLNKLKA